MRIETERLVLFPLTYHQLVLYLQSNNKLEEELNLAKGQRTVPPELAEAFHELILPAVNVRSKNYLLSTLWTIVCKEQNHMVADLCFKGEPTGEGEVEIGYGTYEAFQGKGYLTEAIKKMTAWAFSQPKVRAILAETEKTNLASHRTLEKNRFKPYKVEGTMVWWKLEKPVTESGKGAVDVSLTEA